MKNSKVAKIAKSSQIADKNDQTNKVCVSTEDGVGLAAIGLKPAVQCAITLKMLDRNPSSKEVTNVDYFMALQEQIKVVNKNDMGRVEEMLIAQAHTLDWLFNDSMQRAYQQEYLQNYETRLRLGLRAQAQCARTLEVLAAIKNPPIMFTKQANLTTGPQQINNGVPAPAQESLIQPNKLSGDGYELLPDTRTSALASRIDAPLEAVGAVDRAKVRKRKVRGRG